MLRLVAFFWLLTASMTLAETPILSAPEAQDRISSGEMVVLDIRSPEEWKETGVAEGAWPVSMHRPDFGQQLQAILAKYEPGQIGLICATGGRTAHVTSILKQNGVEGITDVSEGMMGNPSGPGWIARGMPVVSVEEAEAAYQAVTTDW